MPEPRHTLPLAFFGKFVPVTVTAVAAAERLLHGQGPFCEGKGTRPEGSGPAAVRGRVPSGGRTDRPGHVAALDLAEHEDRVSRQHPGGRT